jgi:ATP/maltotriose-dependent transcriptional regulator MalT
MAETELLERDAQLELLSSLLASARAGEGRVALVYGEAGIGKTALLTRFARTTARETRLFWGACDPLSTPRPLAPLLDMVASDPGGLGRRIGAGAARDDLFQALFEELRTPRRPALVVFEDVHWADEATLDLLRFLGRRVERTSALLVLSWRDEGIRADHPLRAALGDLPQAAAARLRLRGLSPEAVQLLGQRAHRSAEGLHAATGGNPLFVTEVLASTAPGVPETVRDAVLSRVIRLLPLARALCELASIVPARVELGLLEAAAGPTFRALDELLGSGIASVDDGAVAFRHELARRAVEDALPPLRRRELHAQVLAALRARGEEPERLARLVHHAAGAGDEGVVLRLAPAAAEHASRLGAHREAEAHLALALRHAGDLPARRRAELLEAHAYECYLIDRVRTGVESCAGACALWGGVGDRVREGNALCWLARMQWFDARTADAQRNADRAIEALQGLPPSRELGMALVTRGALHATGDDGVAALPDLERGLELARSFSDHQLESHALNILGALHVQVGDERGWAEMEESLSLALREGLQDAAGRAYANLGSQAVEERRHPQAAHWLDQGIAYAAERDLRTRVMCMYCWRARLRVETGRWVGASEDADRILENPGSSAMFRLAALTARALLRVRRGDPGAREALDEARALATENDELERLVPVAAARAEHLWLQGDAAAGAAEVSTVIQRAREVRRPWYVGELAVWAWRGGSCPPPAEECALPVALHLRGDWRGATREYRRMGCTYHAALCAFESGDPEALLEALEALEGLGARPAAARVRRRLSELGVRGVPRGPRAARREHPFDLTAREQEVLDALSQGLSNAQIAARLFVSPKTVDHHVSAVLGKLGVASRAAAAARARENGLLGPAEGAGAK